ncbi:MAG TPA: hypothetical protein VI454_14750 [Verrucomicrobiae bacterium]|jgi:hypothetical protein
MAGGRQAGGCHHTLPPVNAKVFITDACAEVSTNEDYSPSATLGPLTITGSSHVFVAATLPGA